MAKKKQDPVDPAPPPVEAENDIKVQDRRFWARKDWDPQDKSASRLPTVLEKLEEKLREGEKRVDEIRERAKQMQQETDSFRGRLERDVEKKISLTKGQFLGEMIEVLDNLERSLGVAEKGRQNAQNHPGFESLLEGLQMVLTMFREKLGRAGVEKVELLNQKYDPECAEAIDVQATDNPALDDVVIEVFQPAYRMNNRVIRAGRVRVAKLKPAQRGDSNEDSVSSDEEEAVSSDG